MEGSEQHIKALRLLNLSQDEGLEVTEDEETHLAQCQACHMAFTVFALLFDKQRPTLMENE